MKPARMRRCAVAVGDPFQIDLRLAGEQHAQRRVLRSRSRPKKLVVDDLADVRDVVRKLPADFDQRPGHDQLRDRQPISRIDLGADRLVCGERALITLTKMDCFFRRDGESGGERGPEGGDDEIVAARVVGVEVVDVNPLRARGAPRQRQAFRHNADAMAARDQRIRLSELHTDAARQRGVFHQIGDVHELRATT